MCELFALNGNVPVAASFSFQGFRTRGGRTGDHVDGWGIGYHDGEACRVYLDEGRACDSVLADHLCAHPPRARTIVGHVRKATQGTTALVNCHPFVREWGGRHWIFCHNGDLKDYAPRLDGSHLPVGRTDSERAFCWLLQELRRAFGCKPPPVDILSIALSELADRVASYGVFNMVLSDGHVMFARATTRLAWLSRRHPHGRARLRDVGLEIDLSAVNEPGDRMVLIATDPLTDTETWTPFDGGESRSFVNGACIWSNTAMAQSALV